MKSKGTGTSKECKKKLTKDQIKFCDSYLRTLSLGQSILEDNVNIDDPAIIDYLKRKRSSLSDLIVTESDLVLRAIRLFEKCTSPVDILDKNGQPTGNLQIDTKGATKVLELLMKHKGMLGNEKALSDSDIEKKQPVNLVMNEKGAKAFKELFDSEY